MWKKILIGALVPLVLGVLAAAGAGIWYFFVRQTPTKVLKGAIVDARERDIEGFKSRFSAASMRALEGSWTGDAIGGGSWNSMMEGLLDRGGAPPQLMDEEIVEQRATVKIRLDGRRRTVYFIQDDGDWRIDVLSGIDVGLSEEARKVQATTAADPDKAKKEKERLAEPKKEGWWKEDKDDKAAPAASP